MSATSGSRELGEIVAAILAEMQNEPPTTRGSAIRRAIEQNVDAIRVLAERGDSATQIAKRLIRDGVKASEVTLRSYIKDAVISPGHPPRPKRGQSDSAAMQKLKVASPTGRKQSDKAAIESPKESVTATQEPPRVERYSTGKAAMRLPKAEDL